MQKRTSEMSFSENFMSIHVVFKNIFEEFKTIVLLAKRMSDLRDKDPGYGSILRRTAL